MPEGGSVRATSGSSAMSPTSSAVLVLVLGVVGIQERWIGEREKKERPWCDLYPPHSLPCSSLVPSFSPLALLAPPDHEVLLKKRMKKRKRMKRMKREMREEVGRGCRRRGWIWSQRRR